MKDLLLFIIRCDCRNMITNSNIHCVFKSLGNEWVLIIIIKKEKSGGRKEGNQFDLNLFKLFLGQWISVILWSQEFAFGVEEQ